MDSEHETGPVAQTAKSDKLVAIGAARYAQQLFGEGEAGWKVNKNGKYVRTIHAPDGQRFTQVDFQNYRDYFYNEFLIKPIIVHEKVNLMTFYIEERDMSWLRTQGLEKNAAGPHLLKPAYNHSIDTQKVKNSPEAILHQTLHSWLLSPSVSQSLHPRQPLGIDVSRLEIKLDKGLVEEIIGTVPMFERKDAVLERKVHAELKQFLPYVRFNLSVSAETGLCILNVENLENCAQAINRLRGQEPITNVTSILQATRLKEGGLKKQ